MAHSEWYCPPFSIICVVKNMFYCVERRSKLLSILARRRSAVVMDYVSKPGIFNKEIFYQKNEFENALNSFMTHLKQSGHANYKIDFDLNFNYKFY